MGLNTLSNNTTRRLDNTYYSVLEKLSVLQNTIQNLKELATMTKKLDETFRSESDELVKDFDTQLNAFEGFEKQQARIELLDERIKKGRGTIEKLAERVEVVRERVESWERGELEWQERTRKRLRLLWIIMSICAAVLLILVASQYTPARAPGPGTTAEINSSSVVEALPDLGTKIRNETGNLKSSSLVDFQDARGGLQNMTTEEENPVEEDPRLRLFDEL